MKGSAQDVMGLLCRPELDIINYTVSVIYLPNRVYEKPCSDKVTHFNTVRLLLIVQKAVYKFIASWLVYLFIYLIFTYFPDYKMYFCPLFH